MRSTSRHLSRALRPSPLEYATHLFTFLGEDSTRYWGPVPLEAWLLAGVLYVVGVAVCRAFAPDAITTLLAFDDRALEQQIPPRSVVDVASMTS